MSFFLKLLDKMGRKRIIYDREGGEPYLERYYILFKERTWFPFNVFIHKFLKSDHSDVHDHPWSYFTWIIKGGYFEWSPEPDGRILREWFGRWHWRFRKATSKHRIELQEGITPWTLFIAFKHKREWGFYPNGKFVLHTKYLEEKGKEIVQNTKNT